MIDTHSHIFSEEFDEDRQRVVKEAIDVGVRNVILANVDSSTIDRLDTTQEQYPDFCLSAMGLHPTSVNEDYTTELEAIKNRLTAKKYIAIGEIGLDLYWETSFVNQQKEVFKTQLQWALELNLPVIIHVRKAFAEVFEVLRHFGNHTPRGVFHCFSGGIQEAAYVTKLGFYLGIGGVLTYKNTNLPEIIKSVGISRLLLETDAPYLAPVPYRGKRNEPKFMVEVLKKMAQVFDHTEERVDEITTLSAKELFGIG